MKHTTFTQPILSAGLLAAVASLWLPLHTAEAADTPPSTIELSFKAALKVGQYITKVNGASSTGGSTANSATAATTSTKLTASKPGSSPKTQSSSASADSWYEFTVTNNSPGALNGLAINYIVYTETNVSANSGGGISMSAVKGSQSLNLKPGGSSTVDTTHVQKESKTSLSGSSSSKGVSSTGTSTNTQVAGYYIEAVLNGKVIKKFESPEGIQAKYAKYGDEEDSSSSSSSSAN